MREADPCALEESAVLQDARRPAAAFRPRPRIRAKSPTVDAFKTLDDAGLQTR